MKIRMKDVLRELQRRDVRFGDENENKKQALIRKYIDDLKKCNQAIEQAQRTLETLLNFTGYDQSFWKNARSAFSDLSQSRMTILNTKNKLK